MRTRNFARPRTAVAVLTVPMLIGTGAIAVGLGAGGTSATGDPAFRPGAHSSGAGTAALAVVPAVSAAKATSTCTMFPADNIWHAKVNKLPVAKHSAAYVKSIGSSAHAHADFGSGTWEGAPFGIPVTKVSGGKAKVKVSFHYTSESDKGPYLIPSKAKVEGGSKATGDRHVIVYDTKNCRSYELYDAHKVSATKWKAGSGAIFNLKSNKLRPKGWTSADAAGLSILVGLAQYGQMSTGAIHHAIRMTVPVTRNAYTWPARHKAGSTTSANYPAMGQRFRLKASVDISHFPKQARIVAQALKTYGAIVADNGSPWYLSGTQDSRWNNDSLHALSSLTGKDFEAVDVSSLEISSSSGKMR